MIIGQAVYLELACLRIIDFLLIGYLLPVHGLFDPRPLTGHYNNALPSSSSYPRPDRERERGGMHSRDSLPARFAWWRWRRRRGRSPASLLSTVSILSIVFASEIACPRATVPRTSRNGGGASGWSRHTDETTRFRICNGEKRVVRYLFDWISLRGIKSW